MPKLLMTLSERIASRSSPQSTGCVHFVGHTVAGYGRIQSGGKSKLAHRIAYELELGPIPDGLCVLHRCDNPLCINVDHLFLGTKADNNADKVAKNRQWRGGGVRGVEHPRAKLKESDIPKIRLDPRPQKQIAADYGVSQSKICHIKTGRNWKHI